MLDGWMDEFIFLLFCPFVADEGREGGREHGGGGGRGGVEKLLQKFFFDITSFQNDFTFAFVRICPFPKVIQI